MAKSGTITIPSGNSSSLFVDMDWEVTYQDIASKKSYINITVYVYSNNQYPSYRKFSSTIYCGQYSNQFNIDRTLTVNNTRQKLGTIGYNATHDSDGKCDIYIGIEGRLYDNTVGGATTYTFGKTLKLISIDSIAEANTPTLSYEPVEIGQKVIIKTNRTINTKHRIRLKFYDIETTLAENVEDQYEWDVPYDLAAQIPLLTTGSGTIYLDTYSSEGLLVGTKQKAFQATVPDNETTKPSMDPWIYFLKDDVPDKFQNYALQGKTRVKIDFRTGSTYSQINERKLTLDNKTYTSNTSDIVTSDKVQVSGAITAGYQVSDRRGYTSTSSYTFYITPYAAPSISGVICERCDENGTTDPSGELLHIKFLKVLSHVDFVDGVALNSCQSFIRWRRGNGSYCEWVAETGEDHILTGITFDRESTYQIQIKVEDEVGESAISTFHLASMHHTLHLKAGGNGIAIGKRAEVDGFDVAMLAFFRSGIGGEILPADTDLNGITEVGKYLIQSDAVMDTIDNKPCGQCGSLYVMASFDPAGTKNIAVNNKYILQIYVSYSASIYIREVHRNGSGTIVIGPWKTVVA